MKSKLLLPVTLAAAFAAWVGWGLYNRLSVERVDYEVLSRLDGVELRRYPTTLQVETTGEDTREAFFRLFRYISGENTGDEEVSMTAPVKQGGEEIEMTAPVKTGSKVPMTAPVKMGEKVSMTAPVSMDGDDEVRMAFFLPSSYDYESAPKPTDERVRLTEQPPRTLAVLSFSWWPFDWRVSRYETKLLRALEDAPVEVVGEPFEMGYDAPWTPPFIRRNEVAVEVRRTK